MKSIGTEKHAAERPEKQAADLPPKDPFEVFDGGLSGTNGEQPKKQREYSWVSDKLKSLVWLVDDMDLTLAEYRLLMHIVRRSMVPGKCWAFQTSMARDTGVHRNWIKKILGKFAAQGIIGIEPYKSRRQRGRDCYVLRPPESWPVGIFRHGSNGEEWSQKEAKKREAVHSECALTPDQCTVSVHHRSRVPKIIEGTKRRSSKQQVGGCSGCSRLFFFR